MKFSLRVGQSFVWGAQRHGWIHQHTIFHPSEPSRKHIHSWKSQESYQGATNGGLLLKSKSRSQVWQLYDITRWTCLEGSLQNCQQFRGITWRSWSKGGAKIIGRYFHGSVCIRIHDPRKNSLPNGKLVCLLSPLAFRGDAHGLKNVTFHFGQCTERVKVSNTYSRSRQSSKPGSPRVSFLLLKSKALAVKLQLEVQIKLSVGHSTRRGVIFLKALQTIW